MSKKRSKKHARRAMLGLAAAATATGMTLAPITPAPDAEADFLDLYTSGLIFEVLPPIPLVENLPADPTVISQTLIADAVSPLGFHFIFGFGNGAFAAGQAIPAVNAAGYPIGVNNYNFVLIRNPGRSNGGLYARFPFLFPEDPVTGDVAPSQTGSLCPVICGFYEPTKADVTWAYDYYSDSRSTSTRSRSPIPLPRASF
jgi:PE-PPE domain